MTQFLSVREAVARHVHDGDTVYLAGFTHLIPFAFGHEIIRRRRHHLTLCRATPDLIYDQMIAAGTATRLVFSYAGNPGLGLLQVIRRSVEHGDLAIEEYTHFELVARLAAGAAGLPFWPLRSLENDLSRRRPRPRVKSPFGDEEVSVVPALRPDVTLVHAHAADDAGNIYAWGLLGEMREAALAAHHLLVSVEEILPQSALRRERDHLLVPGFRVDSVSVSPWGAHPSYVMGRYDRDSAAYTLWDRISRDPRKTEEWLERYVYGVADREAYVGLLDAERLKSLEEAARDGA